MSVTLSPSDRKLGGILHRGKLCPPGQSATAVAALIDWENLKWRLYALGNELDARRLADVAAGHGSVAVMRAYADWSHPLLGGDQIQVRAAGIEPVSVPARRASNGELIKNAADVALAWDAAVLCRSHPEIGTFLLVTGDGDLSYPARQLRETYGRRIVVVSPQSGLAADLRRTADAVLTYEVEPAGKCAPLAPSQAPQRSATPADHSEEGDSVGEESTPATSLGTLPAESVRGLFELIGELASGVGTSRRWLSFGGITDEALRRGLLPGATRQTIYLLLKEAQQRGCLRPSWVVDRRAPLVRSVCNSSRQVSWASLTTDEERLLLDLLLRLQARRPFTFRFAVDHLLEEPAVAGRFSRQEVEGLLTDAVRVGAVIRREEVRRDPKTGGSFTVSVMTVSPDRRPRREDIPA